MKNRTFDEMISHFNITVSEMQITQKQKMELLGIITAIATKHNESVKHGHWEEVPLWEGSKGHFYKCSKCLVPSWSETGYCCMCGTKMDEVTE